MISQSFKTDCEHERSESDRREGKVRSSHGDRCVLNAGGGETTKESLAKLEMDSGDEIRTM